MQTKQDTKSKRETLKGRKKTEKMVITIQCANNLNQLAT